MLLKHRRDRCGGEGDLYVHVVTHSGRILMDGSSETASTPKIVGIQRIGLRMDRETTRPPVRRPHRES